MRIKRSDAIAYDALPLELVSLLETMIVRARRIIVFRGSLATVAVAIITTMIMMAIDCTTVIESSSMRWSLTTVGFLTILVAAYKTIWKPLRVEITLTDIARLIEINNPQLEERISSAIELVSEKDGYLNSDSKLLVSDLVRKARVDVNTITPQNELTFKTATPQMICAAVVVPLLITVFSIWPYEATLTFARALFPSSNIGNIYAKRLNVSPGNIEIKAGDSLTIIVTTKDLETERIEFRRLAPDGTELIERMRLTETTKTSKEFSLEIPEVPESFRYRIMARKALTKYFEVRAYQMPEIKHLSIKTIPPTYTERSEYLQGNNEYLKALYGSKLVFDVEFTKPVLSELYVKSRAIGAKKEQIAFSRKKQWTVPLQGEFGAPMQTWKITQTDKDGNVGEEQEFPLVVSKDTAPSINISVPQKERLTLNDNDTFKIEYYAYDDFSILTPKLVVYNKGKSIYTKDLQAPVLHKKNIWQGSVELDLNQLPLKGINLISAAIIISDNFPKELGGSHIAKSKPITIKIDRGALSLEQQTINIQQEKIKKALIEIITKLKPIYTLLQRSLNIEKKDRTSKYIQKNFSGSRSELLQISTRLTSLAKQLYSTEFKTVARDIEYMRKDRIASATQGMELMMLSDPIDYPFYLQEIAKETESAINGLKKILLKIDTLAAKVKELAELEAIAKRQSALAKAAESIESKQQLKSWKTKQNKVIKRLADLLRKNKKEQKKDMINDLDTLNRLIALAKSIVTHIKNGKHNDINVRKAAKTLIIDSVTLATKVEYVHQPSDTTKTVKVAAVRLNKKLSESSVVLLENALNAMRKLINKKAKSMNFDQTNMGTEGMSESLKKAIKARMASTKKQAQNMAKETVKSLESFKKELTGGVGLSVGMPKQSAGNADAVLNVDLGQATEDWTKIGGQLETKLIKSKQDKIPAEYKDLVNKYFEELKKQK